MFNATPTTVGGTHCLYCGVRVEKVKRWKIFPRYNAAGDHLYWHVATYSIADEHHRVDCTSKYVSRQTGELQTLQKLAQIINRVIADIQTVDPEEVRAAQARLEKIAAQLQKS